MSINIITKTKNFTQIKQKQINSHLLSFMLLVLLILFNKSIIYAQPTTQLISSNDADTWLAMDALGREITVAKEIGGIRKDRFVGIFYFVWHGAHGYDRNKSPNSDDGVKEKLISDTISPYDISKLLEENSEKPKYGPDHAFHYWGEPYFGYYLPDDEWIIRKHGQMLSDAGVDVLILDVTNASIYLPQVTKIVETYQKMRQEGQTTPQIAFIVNSAPEKTVKKLYEQVYEKGLFKDFWFFWKGKPLLLCPPKGVTKEIEKFFTIRQSWAWSKGQEWFDNGKDKWTWLDHTPQSYGWHESKHKPEQISVAIAEHPVSNIGRSFHNGKQPQKVQSGLGLYFSEQWKRALEVDPEFVFVTGWNEWVAMRFMDGKAKQMMGKDIKLGDDYFVDLYNEEYSRDAEPVKGKFHDNYYYQLVDNIRKYKGARPLPNYRSSDNIKIDGEFSDWDKVEAKYKDDKGDTFHRKHPGWGRIKEYVNTTGRNDIIESKITSNDSMIFFYVKTAHELSPKAETNWMSLLIKTQSSSINWEGYNFVINNGEISSKLQRYTKDNKWVVVEPITILHNKSEMELSIPKSAIGIIGNTFSIDFKWTDNIPVGDAMLWLDNGDTAPNARFRYRYNKL
jgi:hypothetical protein